MTYVYNLREATCFVTIETESPLKSHEDISRSLSIMPPGVLHEITAIPGRGNALTATRLILKGETIFVEKPAMWHSRSTSEGFCSSCGKLVVAASDEDPSKSSVVRIRCNHFRNRSIDSITGSSSDGASNSCAASYCSLECRDAAEFSGHKWLCGEKFAERYKVRGSDNYPYAKQHSNSFYAIYLHSLEDPHYFSAIAWVVPAKAV